MKTILLFTFSILVALPSFAQLGTAFPPMDCQNVDGVKSNVPNSLKGKKSVLCLAYSQKAQEKLQGWIDASVHNLILRSSEKSLIPEEPYDIHAFFIAMLTGANQNLSAAAEGQIRKNIDVQLHPYILVYKGELEPIKSKLKMDVKDDPYVFVLDEKGKVIYVTHGVYTDKAMDEIEELIAEEE
ncbi:MAG: hypothetical protein K0R51_186 [Cytophagaceae bacterium]|jgi:hypothetical protein|nr:hypothetical protein [Cytophagaceae bacterium]